MFYHRNDKCHDLSILAIKDPNIDASHTQTHSIFVTLLYELIH